MGIHSLDSGCHAVRLPCSRAYDSCRATKGFSPCGGFNQWAAFLSLPPGFELTTSMVGGHDSGPANKSPPLPVRADPGNPLSQRGAPGTAAEPIGAPRARGSAAGGGGGAAVLGFRFLSSKRSLSERACQNWGALFGVSVKVRSSKGGTGVQSGDGPCLS